MKRKKYPEETYRRHARHKGYGRSRRRRKSNLMDLFPRILMLLLILLIAGAVIFMIRSFFSSDQKDASGPLPSYQEELSEDIHLEPETAAVSETSSDTGIYQDPSVSEEDDPDLSSGPEASEEPKTASLLFAGDIYLSSHVLAAYDSRGNVSGILSDDLLALIRESDIFMANLEFPFSLRGEPEDEKSFTFRVDPARVGILKELGVDILSLANNHTLDFGREALQDTLDTLDGAGISRVGAGRSRDEAAEAVIRTIGGKSFAFIAASRVLPRADWTAGPDTPGINSIYDAYKERIYEKLKELSEVTDYQIVYIHWGTERKETPDDYMYVLAGELAEAGADLIIGSHPHVLQPIEYVGDVPVAYSLGNFLFGSSIPSTMLLSVEWDLESGRPSLSLHPAKGALGYTEGLTDEAEISEFIDRYSPLHP